MVEFTNPFSNKKKNKVNTEDNLVIDSSIESLADNPPAESNNEITLENVAEEALKDNTPASQPIVTQSQTSNLPRLPKIAPADDRAFAELFEEGDNEESELYRAKQETSFGESYKKEVEDKIIELIERNINDLKKKYPTGGIKASRYITTEVLIMAPAGYFDKYLNDVSRGVDYVRNKLADADKSDMIRTAQDNPTDDALQDRAFFLVHSLASEFMKNSIWRETNRSIVVSFICNEIVGFGRIDPLWRDRSIDEIMCNGPKDIQIEIRGEITKVPGCYFNNQAHLMELIDRLYGAIGKTVSMTTAMVKGRLHDKSRMYATHPVISPDGPNFSIRRHPEKFWAPNDLVQRNSASPEMMSYIGNLIYKGASVAITGGTHSGKTSLLNALTGFYKPRVRILTLEDNIEMKPNPKKYLAAAMECRAPAVDRPSDKGVSMRDLVKGSLQLRPDAIIVGEVTDDAAFDLCQALNTGHAGMSTIHANSSVEAIPRIASLIAQGGLVTAEGSLELISSAFDVVVSVKHFPLDGSRRIVSVDEVGSTPVEINGRLTLPVYPLWKFIDEGLNADGKVIGHWEQVGDISKERQERKLLNIEESLNWEDLKELSSIPGQE